MITFVYQFVIKTHILKTITISSQLRSPCHQEWQGPRTQSGTGLWYRSHYTPHEAGAEEQEEPCSTSLLGVLRNRTLLEGPAFTPSFVTFPEPFLLVLWDCCVNKHPMFTISSVINHPHGADEETEMQRMLTAQPGRAELTFRTATLTVSTEGRKINMHNQISYLRSIQTILNIHWKLEDEHIQNL